MLGRYAYENWYTKEGQSNEEKGAALTEACEAQGVAEEAWRPEAAPHTQRT